MIPISMPDLQEQERTLLLDCFDSSFISSQSKYINMFEDLFSVTFLKGFSVAVSNGTVALKLALECLQLEKPSKVLVPCHCFISPVNMILDCGHIPIFYDIDPVTLQILPESISCIDLAEAKAAVIVHSYSVACEVPESWKDLLLIEDCAEALGTRFTDGSYVGTKGIFSTFSFFANKAITTGEGGMVCTYDKTYAELLTNKRDQFMSAKERYFHNGHGYNFRMTGMQAAVGVAQLRRWDEIAKTRNAIGLAYKELLSELPIIIVFNENRSVNWITPALVESINVRNEIEQEFASNNIQFRPFFRNVTEFPYIKVTQKHFIDTGSKQLSNKGLFLPTFNTLQTAQIELIAEIIKKVILK